MNRRRRFLLSAAIVVLVIGIALTTTCVYSAGQLRALKGQVVYTTPEEGMRELIANHYSGVERIEIIHAGKEIFNDLWFVEVRVWADSRVSGGRMKYPDGDNPGCFFLRLPKGWVLVPEGRFPWIVAFGKWLFGFWG